MLSSLAVKVMFISRMTDSSLIFICWRQFSIERGEEGELRAEIEVLEEEIDERILDQLWRLHMILEIVDACIFLLIDMMLQNEDLKSCECKEDVKNRK